MKKKIFATTALLCCFTVCFAIATSLTGKWKGSIKSPDGDEFPLTYDFKTDSGKLTGTITAPQGNAPIVDGETDGSDFNFTVKVSGAQAILTGRYYPAADSVGLDIDFNGMTFHSTLKRSAQ